MEIRELHHIGSLSGLGLGLGTRVRVRDMEIRELHHIGYLCSKMKAHKYLTLGLGLGL